MTLETLQQLAALGVPDSRHGILRAGRQPGSVRADRQRVDVLHFPLQHGQLGVGLPQQVAPLKVAKPRGRLQQRPGRQTVVLLLRKVGCLQNLGSVQPLLGFILGRDRLVLVDHRPDRQQAHHPREHGRADAEDRRLPVLAGQVPLLDLVEPHPQQPGEHLHHGVRLAVLVRPGIRRDRFRLDVRQVAVFIGDHLQRWRETFLQTKLRLVQRVRFPVDNQADDPVLLPQLLERAHLLVHPLRLGRAGRADDDQVA